MPDWTVPTLFFNEEANGHLEVVDGKQRLTSIYSFVSGVFPDGSDFRLAGLEVFEELNGFAFGDLSEAQRETSLDFALNVHTIAKGCEPDFVFEVFERLNMGATQLNEQELRNCIYIGAWLAAFIHSLLAGHNPTHPPTPYTHTLPTSCISYRI